MTAKPVPEYVYIPRPRCPACKGTQLRTIRSIRTDDSQRRTTICKKCRTRFFVVVE